LSKKIEDGLCGVTDDRKSAITVKIVERILTFQ